MARPGLGLGPLPEVRVHAQIVADTVLPPVIVRTKVWEIFTGKSKFLFPADLVLCCFPTPQSPPDPLVDLGHGQ